MSMAVDSEKLGTVRPFLIPTLALLAGGVAMATPRAKPVGRLVLYFGAQSFMNIFMGWLFRTRVTVSKGYQLPSGDVLESDLHGCPVGFALTAMQQIISFSCFAVLYGCLYLTRYRIVTKQVTSCYEVFSICMFGCVFALNVALNNCSLGYVSIAVNLIIRSCLPLTTFLSSQGLAAFGLYPFKPCRALDISLMVVGVFCAGAFAVAKIMGSAGYGESSSNMVLGVSMCLASLVCGSLHLALGGVLGEMRLSVYDTVAYMSLPSTLFLLPIALYLQKPVPDQWTRVLGTDRASDWQILTKVSTIAPGTFGLFFVSGIFSFAYNVIQFSIVQSLSPSATAFSSNFNKAALVFLTLVLPFLQVHALPGPPYIYVIWVAVVGNVAAFALYSHIQIKDKEARRRDQLQSQEDGKSLREGTDGL